MFFSSNLFNDDYDDYMSLSSDLVEDNNEDIFNIPNDAFLNSKKRLNIILDLDNTLICSISKNVKTPPILNYSLNHTYYQNYIIYGRPYLHYFLTEINKFANISVWTAAGKEYANFVVNHFFPPSIKLTFFYHGEHTEQLMRSSYKMKPLNYLFERYPNHFNKYNTLIIDDLPFVIQSNKEYSIQITPFEINESKINNYYDLMTILNDNELVKILNKLISV
jgi:hypothetical protein